MMSSLVGNLHGIAPEAWHSDANSEAQVRVLFFNPSEQGNTA